MCHCATHYRTFADNCTALMLACPHCPHWPARSCLPRALRWHAALSAGPCFFSGPTWTYCLPRSAPGLPLAARRQPQEGPSAPHPGAGQAARPRQRSSRDWSGAGAAGRWSCVRPAGYDLLPTRLSPASVGCTLGRIHHANFGRGDRGYGMEWSFWDSCGGLGPSQDGQPKQDNFTA